MIWGTGVFVPTGSQLSSSEVIDASGNVYTTGFFQGTVDFDPGPGVDEHTAFGGFDVFVTKLDSAGDHVWTLSGMPARLIEQPVGVPPAHRTITSWRADMNSARSVS